MVWQLTYVTPHCVAQAAGSARMQSRLAGMLREPVVKPDCYLSMPPRLQLSVCKLVHECPSKIPEAVNRCDVHGLDGRVGARDGRPERYHVQLASQPVIQDATLQLSSADQSVGSRLCWCVNRLPGQCSALSFSAVHSSLLDLNAHAENAHGLNSYSCSYVLVKRT